MYFTLMHRLPMNENKYTLISMSFMLEIFVSSKKHYYQDITTVFKYVIISYHLQQCIIKNMRRLMSQSTHTKRTPQSNIKELYSLLLQLQTYKPVYLHQQTLNVSHMGHRGQNNIFKYNVYYCIYFLFYHSRMNKNCCQN